MPYFMVRGSNITDFWNYIRLTLVALKLLCLLGIILPSPSPPQKKTYYRSFKITLILDDKLLPLSTNHHRAGLHTSFDPHQNKIYLDIFRLNLNILRCLLLKWDEPNPVSRPTLSISTSTLSNLGIGKLREDYFGNPNSYAQTFPLFLFSTQGSSNCSMFKNFRIGLCTKAWIFHFKEDLRNFQKYI